MHFYIDIILFWTLWTQMERDGKIIKHMLQSNLNLQDFCFSVSQIFFWFHACEYNKIKLKAYQEIKNFNIHDYFNVAFQVIQDI